MQFLELGPSPKKKKYFSVTHVVFPASGVSNWGKSSRFLDSTLHLQPSSMEENGVLTARAKVKEKKLSKGI